MKFLFLSCYDDPKKMQAMGYFSLRVINYLIIFLCCWGTPFSMFASEFCSRSAIINYQNVLVDTGSNGRGEGLRYYLQKDPVAKKLLDDYQINDRDTWQTTILSSVGVAMIFGGMVRTNRGEDEVLTSKRSLIFGGFGLIGLSYLISKTKRYSNENLLFQSVEEYNKRNTPKIYFSTGFESNMREINFGIQKDF